MEIMKYIGVFLSGVLLGGLLGYFYSKDTTESEYAIDKEEISETPITQLHLNELHEIKSSPSVKAIKHAIDQQQMEVVSGALSQVQFTRPQLQELNHYLKSHLIKLSKNKRWNVLDNWLVAMELAALMDSDIYRLQAKVLMARHRYLQALESVFLAHEMASSQQEQSQIIADVKNIINRVINAFNDKDGVLIESEFEQFLLYAQQQLQEYIPISLSLAQVYWQQGELQKALDILSFLPYDEQYTPKVDDLVSKLQEAQALALINSQGIQLIKSGSQFLVDVNVGGELDLVLLIDTGASYTSLSRQAIERIANQTNALSDELKKVKVNTANGSTVARVFKLSSLALEQTLLKNISVLEVNMGDHNRSDGLLGMNFLGKFKFKIDQENGLLFLEAK